MTTSALTLGPGLYPDVPAEVYHADPVEGGSLSSSGARKIIPPKGCPARYRYDIDHPPTKPEWDFGHVAHRLVLGDGDEYTVIDAPDWRTKIAKEARTEAREAGRAPILTKDFEVAQAMAAAIKAHPTAAALLDPNHGAPEQTLIWQCPTTGIMCRARLDWLRNRDGTGRLVIPDYKTTTSAALDDLINQVRKFGYHQQADLYVEGAQAVGLGGPDTAFVFIAQEKTPPYLVTTFELDRDTMRAGRAMNLWAKNTYRHCKATDTWPAYHPDIALLRLPEWTLNEQLGDQ